MIPFNTRIAPSPTGDMHLGTVRTAYFNWLIAKASGGTFLLRIDDTDQARNDQRCVDDILEVFQWLELDYDRIEYQSKRLNRYKEVAEMLLIQGMAQQLDNGAVQLVVGDDFIPPSFWVDEIAGNINISGQDMDSTRKLILLRGDSSPTYNFASIVDDYDFNINYILRGKDHTSNTAKQVILWQFCTQKPVPKFAHVGLLTDKGKKLSKREGAASTLTYKREGFDPDALLNYVLRMGWGPKVDDKTTSVLPKEKAIQMFLTEGNLRNSSANIDLDKLKALDRKYKARKKL